MTDSTTELSLEPTIAEQIAAVGLRIQELQAKRREAVEQQIRDREERGRALLDGLPALKARKPAGSETDDIDAALAEAAMRLAHLKRRQREQREDAQLQAKVSELTSANEALPKIASLLNEALGLIHAQAAGVRFGMCDSVERALRTAWIDLPWVWKAPLQGDGDLRRGVLSLHALRQNRA